MGSGMRSCTRMGLLDGLGRGGRVGFGMGG